MLLYNPLTQHHEGVTELLVSTPNRDNVLRMAIDLLSEGGDSSAGNVGDLLQATAAVSNHMFHKVFGDNQKGRKAVR